MNTQPLARKAGNPGTFSELNNPQKDLLVPFFLLTFLITWGIGAFAIFLPT